MCWPTYIATLICKGSCQNALDQPRFQQTNKYLFAEKPCINILDIYSFVCNISIDEIGKPASPQKKLHLKSCNTFSI